MKKALRLALCSAMGFSLIACGGGQSTSQPEAAGTAAEAETTTEATEAVETLTGTAEGFGGEVTVTLTRSGETITECRIEGGEETPAIGGAALEELQKQVVAANGFEIDGVSGATVTSKAVKGAVAAALGETYEEETTASAAAETAAEAELVQIDGGLQLGLAYGAAHGTKCFTEAYAVVQDDVIVAAYVDEFQFISGEEDVTGVPNSDSDFAAGYAEGMLLCSKRDNAKYYSELMKSHGNATVAIDVNFDAIQSFVVGKTIEEVEAAAGEADVVDAVSGATLADTAGYLKVIAKAARNAKETQAVEFTGDSDTLKLSVAYGAAHGTKCFTAGAALTDGEKIILSYLDDFQFISDDADITGVPNGDAEFAEGFAEGNMLCSKRMETAYYSKNMAEKGGATIAIDKNFDAIQNHVNGMSIAEAAALAGKEDAVDSVSGATLADTAGYIGVIVEAAQK